MKQHVFPLTSGVVADYTMRAGSVLSANIQPGQHLVVVFREVQ
jgi:hypothetical protein